MTGTIINTLAIIAGGLVGWKAGSLFTEKIRGTVISALGIVVMALGVEMVLDWGSSSLQIIIAVVLGGLLGEWMDIEGRLEIVGWRLEQSMGRQFKGDIAKGFVYATLIYCVGPMAILGAMQSGLYGNHEILMAKASLDGFTAIAFASTLGIGVVFSSVPVFLYQGLLTLGACYVSPVVQQAGTELTVTGGILILGLGLKILELKQVRVANLLPALPIVVLMTWLF